MPYRYQSSLDPDFDAIVSLTCDHDGCRQAMSFKHVKVLGLDPGPSPQTILRRYDWSLDTAHARGWSDWRVYCPLHTLVRERDQADAQYSSSLVSRLLPDLPLHDAPSLQWEAPVSTPAASQLGGGVAGRMTVATTQLPLAQGMVRGSWLQCASGKFPGYHRKSGVVDSESSTLHQEESHV